MEPFEEYVGPIHMTLSHLYNTINTNPKVHEEFSLHIYISSRKEKRRVWRLSKMGRRIKTLFII